MRRVDESIRQVLSEALPELKDPRIGFVTITGVKTQSDLKTATVYVSILGGERKRELVMKTLRGEGGEDRTITVFVSHFSR